MKQFIIHEKVFEKLPEVCFGAVIAKGIPNGGAVLEIENRLREEVAAAHARLQGVELKEYPPVGYYREAFVTLGINPNKFQNSVEALNKRIMKGGSFPEINPIVDMGNAMSLKYTLPMGAHDIEKLEGDLEVRLGMEGDHFTPMGTEEAEAVDVDEMVYASGKTVKTRRWIWRQSEDGKIDANSSYVVFPIDGFLGKNDEQVLAAQKELAAWIVACFGCPVKTAFLHKGNQKVEL